LPPPTHAPRQSSPRERARLPLPATGTASGCKGMSRLRLGRPSRFAPVEGDLATRRTLPMSPGGARRIRRAPPRDIRTDGLFVPAVSTPQAPLRRIPGERPLRRRGRRGGEAAPDFTLCSLRLCGSRPPHRSTLQSVASFRRDRPTFDKGVRARIGRPRHAGCTKGADVELHETNALHFGLAALPELTSPRHEVALNASRHARVSHWRSARR
jgi:hypothetical protein